VTELVTRHLIAEYRELPRTFALVIKAIARGERVGHKASKHYTLGAGHVRFFYDKLGYLAKRQDELIGEMLKRGYKPTFTDGLWHHQKSIPVNWWNDWMPTEQALAINRERISDRLKDMM